MSELVVLGDAGTKRTQYFQLAARKRGVSVRLAPWGSGDLAGPPAFVKIDPPASDNYFLARQAKWLADYRARLEELAALPHRYYNHPEALWLALDKRDCKETLAAAGAPVTEMLAEAVHTPAALRESLAHRRWPGAFIKPRFGSAAAGVLAYRFQPKSGREVLYTCAALKDGRLVNTKTLSRLADREAIETILGMILAEEAVVERWYPKAKTGGLAYDLRAVVQFGRLDYLVARASRGPITNLQLNNGAIAVDRLNLAPDVLKRVEDVCLRAMEALPGLGYAGIDVLLEEATLRPYIVEINGQGDLLYQDIYADNRIYTRQIDYYLQQQEVGHGTI